jgi:hypothetical protein
MHIKLITPYFRQPLEAISTDGRVHTAKIESHCPILARLCSVDARVHTAKIEPHCPILAHLCSVDARLVRLH